MRTVVNLTTKMMTQDPAFQPIIEPTLAPRIVSARQFKMQLEISGITDPVETWVDAQSSLIKIAYDNSASFNREDPMLQSGFTALGLSSVAVDQFFAAAALL